MSEPGFIYVLENPCMPGLVKIGRTKNHPAERASALFTTGVPAPFNIVFSMWCDDAVQAEAEIHDELNNYRHSPGREFFRMQVGVAIKWVADSLLGDNGLSVVDEFNATEDVFAYLCHVTGCHSTEIRMLLNEVSDAAWADAYSRVSQRKMKRITLVENN